MLNPFGLQNPYAGADPNSVPAQMGAVAPVTPETSAEQQFAAPLPIAFAATEADVQRAQDAETNPNPGPNPDPTGAPAPGQVAPGGFLSGVPGARTAANPSGAQAGAQVPPGDPSIWESPENPYRRNQPNQLEQINATLANLGNDAESALGQLIAGGMDPRAARATVEQAATQTRLMLENQRLQVAAAPAVRRHVAADIAQKFSIPGVTISADDLIREPSPDAMIARARTTVELRRASQSQQRVAQRVDVVESSSGITPGMRTVARAATPFELIRSGLRRR